MTSTIFKEALEQLDHLGIFPRVNGMKPVLLVDGHGSRFGLDFWSISMTLLIYGLCASVFRMELLCGRLAIVRNIHYSAILKTLT